MLEKTLESPVDSKEIKAVILKEISPEYSLEGLMLKLKLQYFGHMMWRDYLLLKTLMLGKTEGNGKGRQTRRWLNGIIDSVMWVWANSRRQSRTGKPGMLQSMGLQRVRHDWGTEQQTDTQQTQHQQENNKLQTLQTCEYGYKFTSKMLSTMTARIFVYFVHCHTKTVSGAEYTRNYLLNEWLKYFNVNLII